MDNYALLKEHWPGILARVKRDHDITNISYNAWLAPLVLLSVEGGCATFLVPSGEIGIGMLRKKYDYALKVAVLEETGLSLTLQYISPDENTVQEEKKTSLEQLLENANLNTRYSFDTFVVGPNNKFAHAAALAVAEAPGEVYNPLYLYAGVGLGKTHLMQSVCRYIMENNPAKKILYVTSETFTNELIEAIRNRSGQALTSFREKYRNIDVLAIDDIQFIMGKESTQEEFFHTFNALYSAKKQIIISSDKPPKDLNILEERIISRLEMGLIADISEPDYETRMAILRRKQELEGFRIDEKILDYIAANVKSNIRVLEGCINRIKAESLHSPENIDVERAAVLLQDFISPQEERRIDSPFIVKTVADYFGISTEELRSEKRNAGIAYPRKIAMYLCREMTQDTQQAVAKALGRKDHTTVISACESIDREIKAPGDTRRDVEAIRKILLRG